MKVRFSGLAVAVLALVFATSAQAKPGDVIVGDSSGQIVYSIEPSSGDTVVVSNDARLVSPNDSVFAPDGTLYFSDYEAFGGTGGVFAVDPVTGETLELASGLPFVQPDGIARGPDGDLFVTDLDAEGGGALFRVDLPSGDVELVSSVADGADLAGPVGVVVPPDGKPIVATFAKTIVRIDPGTGAQTLVASAADGLTAGAGLSRAADGTLFTTGSSTVQSVDPRTGTVDLVANTSSNGYGIATDLRGHVLAGDTGNLLDIDPASGNVVVVSPAFQFIEGLEVEPPRCGGQLATIVGSPGPDRLHGSRFADVIVGLGGGDVIRGLGSGDRICGGSGPDRIDGGKGGDWINGGGGRDNCSVDNGRDRSRQCE
jgi:sugar lactone lactonase YvrE